MLKGTSHCVSGGRRARGYRYHGAVRDIQVINHMYPVSRWAIDLPRDPCLCGTFPHCVKPNLVMASSIMIASGESANKEKIGQAWNPDVTPR